MPSHRVKFPQEELHNAFSENLAPAEKIVKNGKLDEFISQVKNWLSKVKNVPVLGKITDDIVLTIELLQDYADKSYTDIPLASIISAVAVLIYVISPIDLIPDFLPVIGYVDDVAVFLLVMDIGLSADLKKYKKWREKIEIQNYDDFVRQVGKEIEKFCKGKTVAAVYLNEKLDGIKILFSDDLEKPLECYIAIMNIPHRLFDIEKIHTQNEILEFYKRVLKLCNITWSPLGKREIKPETNGINEDEFVIISEDEND